MITIVVVITIGVMITIVVMSSFVIGFMIRIVIHHRPHGHLSNVTIFAANAIPSPSTLVG